MRNITTEICKTATPGSQINKAMQNAAGKLFHLQAQKFRFLQKFQEADCV